MSRYTILCLLALPLLVSGCAHTPNTAGSAHSGSSPLQHWVDSELSPYLAKQLAEHPRFKGKPVILVRLDGPDVQSEIDGLTRSMRDQLQDVLLTTPGLHLPWQPRQAQQQHHRRLQPVNCERLRDAWYFVGIEVTRIPTGEHRVAVRALDVRQGEWVSGFGKHWRGTLSAQEQRALQETHIDESLRGLRVLPFNPGQPDLAAAYLANNLSCLLRQQDEDDLVLFVESSKTSHTELRTLLKLIGNNLSRYREVRVTDTRKEANFVLRGESHRIQAGLYQVWVVLRPARSGQHLAGMDTATWMRIGVPTRRVHKIRPAIIKTAAPRKPVIARLGLAHHRPGTRPDTRCARPGNWSGNDCRAVEMTVEAADKVFVFTHARDHGLARVFPASCSASIDPIPGQQNTDTYRLSGIDWSKARAGTVYAIAVNGQELDSQFARLLQTLPDACAQSAGARGADIDQLDRWLDELDRLLARNGTRTSWSAIRIP